MKTKTPFEIINETFKGGCYRLKGDSEEKVFHFNGLEFESGRPYIKVCYPVLEIDNHIFFNERLQDLEYVPVTEIDKIRARYDASGRSNLKECHSESNILTLDLAREARDKKERTKAYTESSHLADHLFPKK